MGRYGLKENTKCNIYVSKLFNSSVFEKRIKFPQSEIFRTKQGGCLSQKL